MLAARSESPCSRRSRGERRLATTGRGSSSPRCSPRGWWRPGHHVTLFATADSITTASLHATAPCGWSEDATIDAKVAECLHIASVFERAGEFDIIHNGFDFLPLTYSDLVDHAGGHHDPRVLVRSDLPVYERYDGTTAYVSISDADRHPNLHYAATIHHGIDVDGFAVASESRRASAVLRTHPPRQGHRRGDRGRPPMWPPARHRRDHPRRGLFPQRGRAAHRRRACALPRRRRCPCARGSTGRCARAAAPDRLRGAVRLQRRRGDGVWHTGDRELEGLDGRADRRTGSAAFWSTTSIRRWLRSVQQASSTGAGSPSSPPSASRSPR